MFGLNMSKFVRGERPISNSAGDLVVVVCGVVLLCSRKLANLVVNSPTLLSFIPRLKICTALSVRLVVDG